MSDKEQSLCAQLKARRFCLILLAISVLLGIYLITVGCSFFPVETWFDQMFILEKWSDHTLRVADLFKPYCEHGMLAEHLLFLLNAKFFNLSAGFEALITCSVPYVMILSLSLFVTRRRDLFKGVGTYGSLFLLCIPLLFLDSRALGMNLQVRLGLLTFVWAALAIDRAVFAKRLPIPAMPGIALLILLSINACGTMYSMAGIPFVCLVMAWDMLRRKRGRAIDILVITSYVFAVLLYFVEYGFLAASASSASSGVSRHGGVFANLLAQLRDPLELAKSFIGWCAGSFINLSTIAEEVLTERQALALGLVALGFYLVSAILYFTSRMYKKTYLPVFLMGYSFVCWGEILVGRPLGWNHTLQSWYTIHEKLLPIGAVLIYAYALSKKRVPARQAPYALLSMGLAILVCFGSTLGLINQFERAPYAKAWNESKVKYLFVKDPEDMPVGEDGMTPLLNTKDLTMRSISYMREHKFNVYRLESYYEDIHHLYSVGSTKATCHFSSGVYDDFWMGSEAQIEIKTLESGVVHIKFYNPFEEMVGREGTIRVDNRSFQFQIGSGMFEMEISCPVDQVVTVAFDFTDFAGKLSDTDDRTLSVILSDIFAK